MSKEIELKSGAKLVVTPAEFEKAKALFQACAEELREIQLGANDDVMSVAKNILCAGVYSKKIEAKMVDCLKKATYNGVTITKENAVFEDESAREDFVDVYQHVLLENVLPFTKNLSALFSTIILKIVPSQA